MLLSTLMAVVLPEAFVALITAGVTFLLVQGAKEVLSIFKIDLSGYVAAATAITVSIIVAFVNGLLGQIPVAWETIANAILNLLVVLLGTLGPFGIFRVYKGFTGARKN